MALRWAPPGRRYSDRPVSPHARLLGVLGVGSLWLGLTAFLLYPWTPRQEPRSVGALAVFDVKPADNAERAPAAKTAPSTPTAPRMPSVVVRLKAEPPKQVILPALVTSPAPYIAGPAAPVVSASPAAEHGPTPPAASSTTETRRRVPANAVESDNKRRADWEHRVKLALDRGKRYPRGARRQRQEGTPRIRFLISRGGRVLSVRLELSSGVPSLDKEALALPIRVQPLPPPPRSVPGETIDLVVPVEFLLS